jgi:Uma2 family endonuclease
MKLPIQNVPLPVRLIYDPPLTDDELLELSSGNDVVWIEREASGALYAKPIGDTANGARSAEIGCDLHIWADADGRGRCFGHGGFILPDGSMRGASCASWVLKERMAALSEEQREKYAPLAPDFVVELLSSMDDADYLRAKMEQWIANGVQVAWLIEPEGRWVRIYRAGEETEVLEAPGRIVGSGVIDGFELAMARVWDLWRR